MRLAFVLLAGLLALGGCAAPAPPPHPVTGNNLGPNPYPPPPPPRQEAIPLPPVSEEQLVWRFGGWEWVGAGYVWRPGEWELLDGHSNQFMPGHWMIESGAWAWVRGHWL